MCSTPAQFAGLLIAVVAVLAMIVMMIRWAMIKQLRLRWRLLSLLLLVMGIAIMYGGA